MLFSCVEKQGKYRDLWTLRRIAFDTETGMLYCTAREKDFRVMWKHQVRVVRIIAKPSVVDIDYKAANFDVRELFSFKVEGSFRHIDASLLSRLEQPSDKHAVVRPLPKRSDSAGKSVGDVGKGNMLAWYMRTDNENDFMKIYTTIRDVLIRDGMRPPQFWGLPKMDPRIEVPLAEPPLYLWCRFRTVKRTVFYACVHGHMAIRDADLSLPGRSVTLCDEPLYLTLFDNSVMVFNEERRLVTGIPAVHIKSLHYSTMEVDASKKDPKNEKCRCFLSFRSNSEEYPDILFVPTLERFADANEENVPAAQVNRVQTALSMLVLMRQQTPRMADQSETPPTELTDVSKLTAGLEDGVESSENGLLDVYAREENARNLLRLPVRFKLENKDLGDKLLGKLPVPHRLSELASQLGIKPKKALTSYPIRYEYLSPGATVADPTCQRKKSNPLRDLLLIGGKY
ncbi:hypothetical protein TcCL_ESM03593 [Trypanosoma cruzi]|nr:hypothetical protein TcCL_ESM03593 [Trypanosoma cruzi]